MNAAKPTPGAGNVLKIELVNAENTFQLERSNQVTCSEIAAGQEVIINLTSSTDDVDGLSGSDEHKQNHTNGDWMPCCCTESLAKVDGERELQLEKIRMLVRFVAADVIATVGSVWLREGILKAHSIFARVRSETCLIGAVT